MTDAIEAGRAILWDACCPGIRRTPDDDDFYRALAERTFLAMTAARECVDQVEGVLLPCPAPWCCGENVKARNVELGGSLWVAFCCDCDTSTPGRKTKADVVALWNTRAALSTRSQSPDVEAMRQGDVGDALDWALGHCDASDALDFLEAWREDRADEEPAYMAWLELQRRCARKALGDAQ